MFMSILLRTVARTWGKRDIGGASVDAYVASSKRRGALANGSDGVGASCRTAMERSAGVRLEMNKSGEREKIICSDSEPSTGLALVSPLIYLPPSVLPDTQSSQTRAVLLPRPS